MRQAGQGPNGAAVLLGVHVQPHPHYRRPRTTAVRAPAGRDHPKRSPGGPLPFPTAAVTEKVLDRIRKQQNKTRRARNRTGEEPSTTRGIDYGKIGEGQRSLSMLSTILIIVLILLLVGALPTWPYSANWGYAPGGLLGTVLVIIVILALLGRI